MKKKKIGRDNFEQSNLRNLRRADRVLARIIRREVQSVACHRRRQGWRTTGVNAIKTLTSTPMLIPHQLSRRSSEKEPETTTSERIKSQESYTVGDEALLIHTYQTAEENMDGG